MCALNAALCADLSPQIVHTCSGSGIASAACVDIFSCFIGLTRCNTFSPAPLGVSLASRAVAFPRPDITN